MSPALPCRPVKIRSPFLVDVGAVGTHVEVDERFALGGVAGHREWKTAMVEVPMVEMKALDQASRVARSKTCVVSVQEMNDWPPARVAPPTT
jgi:hypothetical protein